MNFEYVWRMVLSFVSNSGIWALLFVVLLIVLITTNGQREEKYQSIIEALSRSLKKVEEIKEDVEDIKFTMVIGGNSRKQYCQKSDVQTIKNGQISAIQSKDSSKEKENDAEGKK